MDAVPDEPLSAPEPERGENEPDSNPRRFFLLALVFETSLIAVALVLGAIVGIRPLATWQWNWLDVGLALLATLPMLAGLWLADRYPLGPLVPLRRLVYDVVVPLFYGTRLWQLAAIALAAGLGEELLFRGLLQAGIDTLLGRWIDPLIAPWIALLAASLIFGLAHFISRTYAVLCFLVGIYLGALWLVSGNLLVPVVIHAVYDFLALIYLLRSGPAKIAGTAD